MEEEMIIDCGGIPVPEQEPDFSKIRLPKVFPVIRRRRRRVYTLEPFLRELEDQGYTADFTPGRAAYVQNRAGETVEFYGWYPQKNSAVFLGKRRWELDKGRLFVISPDNRGIWADSTCLLYPVED